MAKSSLLSILFLVIMATMAFHASFSGAATCNQSCKSNDGCDGELACNDGKCGDDPEVGTNICGGGDGSNGGADGSNGDAAPPPPSGEAGGGGGGTCRSSGKLSCGDNSFPQFTCSPPVTASTRATLSVNSFSKGGDGGDPSECDGKFHDDDSPVVALSTGWYDGGSRCGKKIRITAKNGKSVEATVVDECDSVNGCDDAHAGQPPCKNNIVDGSPAVWDALGLDQDVGLVDVTWAEA